MSQGCKRRTCVYYRCEESSSEPAVTIIPSNRRSDSGDDRIGNEKDQEREIDNTGTGRADFGIDDTDTNDDDEEPRPEGRISRISLDEQNSEDKNRSASLYVRLLLLPYAAIVVILVNMSGQ